MAVHVPPRIYRRVPFETTVRLCYDRFRGFVDENSANLSLGGMFIQTDERPPLGTELSVEFRLEDGFELIRGTGRVSWVRDEPAGPDLPAGIGIRFLELTPGSRELIFRLVDRRVKEGKTPFDLDEAAPKAQGDPLVHAPSPGQAAGPTSPVPLPEPWEPSRLPAGLEADLAAGEPGAAGVAAERPDPAPPRDDPEPAEAPEPDRELPPAAEEPPRREPPPEDDPRTPPEPPRELTAFHPPLDPVPPPREEPPRQELPGDAFHRDGLDRDETRRGEQAAESRTLEPSSEQAVHEAPPRRGPRWGRVALAATVAVLLLAVVGAWWAQRTGLLGSENLGGVEGPLTLRPEEVAPAPQGAAGDAAGGAAEDAAGAAATLAPAALAGAALTEAGDAAADSAGNATGDGTLPVPAETVEIADTPRRAPTRLENLTWSAGDGRTDLLLWTNGAVGPASYSHFRIGGDDPRLVVRLRGIEQPYARGQVAVGTPQVERIRTGFHSDRRPSELHVVFDLAAPGVELARIEDVGGRLRIVLEGP